MKRFVGPLLILSCTVIWGSAFVAQKTGAEHYGPFTLTCYRNLLAAAFLALFCRWRTGLGRTELVGGCLSGLLLFVAMVTQQLGIEHTTPGVSAFLTANYILIVPFFAWIFLRRRPSASVWLGVVLALVGTYLICLSHEGTGPLNGLKTLGPGELWTLLCAFVFAGQIMIVDRFAPRCDVIKFSMVQLFASAVCAAPFLLLPSETSRLTLAHFKAGWFSLFYVGILSSGVAYTLQNLGQARTPAALASIVMSFESVVGAVSGWLFLGDVLTAPQILGCTLVFSSIILTQACSLKNSRTQNNALNDILHPNAT